MHYDPFMLKIVGALLGILAVAFISRALRQPHVVGYLAAGVLLGPHGLALLTERTTLSRIGEFGVLMLLFFIGMENNPRDLLSRWRITFIGTAAQVAGSVLCIALLGWWLHWSTPRILLLGFVISLSSTALVLNYLRETGQTQAKLGRDALGVLLAQDLAVIPMLIAVDYFGAGEVDGETIALQLVGGALSLALLAWLVWSRSLRPVPGLRPPGRGLRAVRQPGRLPGRHAGRRGARNRVGGGPHGAVPGGVRGGVLCLGRPAGPARLHLRSRPAGGVPDPGGAARQHRHQR